MRRKFKNAYQYPLGENKMIDLNEKANLKSWELKKKNITTKLKSKHRRLERRKDAAETELMYWKIYPSSSFYKLY